jgi:cytochrome c peroxidase
VCARRSDHRRREPLSRAAILALLLVSCAPPARDPALVALSPVPPPPADVSNAWADDPAAARFGQRLFFDPSFAGALLDGDNDGTEHATGSRGDTGTVSCASCHVPTTDFSDTRSLLGQISLGAAWGFRRAPSLLDVGHSRMLMWDGRFDSLFSQVFGPIESELEMNGSRLYAAERAFALHRAEYEAIFGPMPPLDDASRFPPLTGATTGCTALIESERRCAGTLHGVPGDGAEFDSMTPEDQDAVTEVVVNLGKALGAYERLLHCGPSRFDAWVAGDEAAMTAAEVHGAELFVGEAGCVSCHSGPTMSDERFHVVGLQPTFVATVFVDRDDRGAGLGLMLRDASPLRIESTYSDGDDGRADFPRTDALEGAFRTPRLRCVAQRPSFMHTGQFTRLEDAVAFHVRGGDRGGYIGTSELVPLDLTADDRADLVAFLRALDGPGPDASLRQAPP